MLCICPFIEMLLRHCHLLFSCYQLTQAVSTYCKAFAGGAKSTSKIVSQKQCFWLLMHQLFPSSLSCRFHGGLWCGSRTHDNQVCSLMLYPTELTIWCSMRESNPLSLSTNRICICCACLCANRTIHLW